MREEEWESRNRNVLFYFSTDVMTGEQLWNFQVFQHNTYSLYGFVRTHQCTYFEFFEKYTWENAKYYVEVAYVLEASHRHVNHLMGKSNKSQERKIKYLRKIKKDGA